MRSTPVKASMDDMFLMSPSIPATQVLLDRCAVALIWARMSFRASQSRSMVIDKGKVIDISPFSFKGEIIPSIHANLVKFWVELLISLCLTNIRLRNLLQKFCHVLS